MLHEKILIYDNNEQRTHTLSSIIDKDQYEVIISQHPSEEDNFKYKMAFISLNLPPIKVSSDCKIATMIDPQKPILAKRNYYGRVEMALVSPISLYEFQRSLSLITKPQADYKNSINELIDLKTIIKSFTTEIKSCDFRTETIDHQLFQFCTEKCPNSQTSDTANSATLDTTHIIHVNTSGLTLYCERKKICRLHIFRKKIKENSELSELLEKVSSENFKSCSSILEYLQCINDIIDKLIDFRKKFCTEICENAIQDLEFQKGDTLLTTFDEVIQGSCVYCNNRDCVLNNFLENLSTTLN